MNLSHICIIENNMCIAGMCAIRYLATRIVYLVDCYVHSFTLAFDVIHYTLTHLNQSERGTDTTFVLSHRLQHCSHDAKIVRVNIIHGYTHIFYTYNDIHVILTCNVNI